MPFFSSWCNFMDSSFRAIFQNNNLLFLECYLGPLSTDSNMIDSNMDNLKSFTSSLLVNDADKSNSFFIILLIIHSYESTTELENFLKSVFNTFFLVL